MVRRMQEGLDGCFLYERSVPLLQRNLTLFQEYSNVKGRIGIIIVKNILVKNMKEISTKSSCPKLIPLNDDFQGYCKENLCMHQGIWPLRFLPTIMLQDSIILNLKNTCSAEFHVYKFLLELEPDINYVAIRRVASEIYFFSCTS